MRQLYVYINQDKIGSLKEENDIWSFEYTLNWLAHKQSYPLSPHIPLQGGAQMDGSTHRYIQWFFDNLLPEEGARALLAKDININSADSFGILSITGAESAGAITLVADDLSWIQAINDGSVDELTAEELNTRINNLPNLPLNNKESKRMSIAGAQHKMLVVMNNDAIYEPNGAMPSTHILKPLHTMPDVYWQSVRNEWFVMSLANKLELNTPDVQVCYFPKAAYIIERFDRKGRYPEQSRLHALDGCQLLGLSKSAKYSQSTVAQLRAFSEKIRAKGQAKITIFRWVIFNALIGNTDAHLKNLTCLFDANGMVLSPMYDLLSTAIYEKEGLHLSAELSQPIGNATTLAALTREDIFVFAHEFGLNIKIAQRTLDALLKNIDKEADNLILIVEEINDIPYKAAELRMLREIRYKIIAEMVAKLKE